MVKHYKNDSEIEAVVKGFEECTTGKDDFTHKSHLTVAVWYLYRFDQAEASKSMRTNLLRFLNRHGVGREKYNETLTRFWLKTVREFIVRLDAKFSLLEMTNAVIERFGNPHLVFEFYSKELLGSEDARQNWSEPDLEPPNC